MEVFIRLHRAAARWRPEAKLSTYLIHIAHNLVLNEWRRRGRKPTTALEFAAEPGDADALSGLLGQPVDAAGDGADEVVVGQLRLHLDDREPDLLVVQLAGPQLLAETLAGGGRAGSGQGVEDPFLGRPLGPRLDAGPALVAHHAEGGVEFVARAIGGDAWVGLWHSAAKDRKSVV